MFALHKLTKITKKRKRVGRGGERGGTAGKGHKGQKARSGGYVRIGYEGGQMPLYRRLPKRGFNNAEFEKQIYIVNLVDIERSFNANEIVNPETMIEKGLLKIPKGLMNSSNVYIKVLGKGDLTKKLDIWADAFSQAAQKTITDLGGQANVIKEM